MKKLLCLLILSACSHPAKLPYSDFPERITEAELAGTTEATARTLQRDETALADLEEVGAKPADTLTPRRVDMVYTLIAKKIPANIKKDSFGLHLRRPLTAKEKGEIVKRYHLAFDNNCEPEYQPSCYVRIGNGDDLVKTMREVLAHEPSVSTLSFNFTEH